MVIMLSAKHVINNWKTLSDEIKSWLLLCHSSGTVSIWQKHYETMILSDAGRVKECKEWFHGTILNPTVPTEHCLNLIAYAAGWNTVADQMHPFIEAICIFSPNRLSFRVMTQRHWVTNSPTGMILVPIYIKAIHVFFKS